MVSYEGSVKLLDFGVAKAAERLVESRAGTIKGKIAYLSPEQCKGTRSIGAATCSRSGSCCTRCSRRAGCTARETDFATMSAIANEPRRRHRRSTPTSPPEIDAIVLQALAKDPDARYPTAATMLNAIEVAAEHGRHVMSVSAMGRFMRELFGERPEPWIDLEQNEQESHAVTITSEAITVGGDALASASGLTAASPMTFPTLDTPGRNAIEEQLYKAPTIGVARSAGEQDENASFEPTPETREALPTPGTTTIDQGAATAVETVTATAATIAIDAPTIARTTEVRTPDVAGSVAANARRRGRWCAAGDRDRRGRDARRRSRRIGDHTRRGDRAPGRRARGRVADRGRGPRCGDGAADAHDRSGGRARRLERRTRAVPRREAGGALRGSADGLRTRRLQRGQEADRADVLSARRSARSGSARPVVSRPRDHARSDQGSVRNRSAEVPQTMSENRVSIVA